MQTGHALVSRMRSVTGASETLLWQHGSTTASRSRSVVRAHWSSLGTDPSCGTCTRAREPIAFAKSALENPKRLSALCSVTHTYPRLSALRYVTLPNPDCQPRGRSHIHFTHLPQPPWRQLRGKWMVSLVNSHTNSTSKRWHQRESDLRFALNSTPGWLSALWQATRTYHPPLPACAYPPPPCTLRINAAGPSVPSVSHVAA